MESDVERLRPKLRLRVARGADKGLELLRILTTGQGLHSARNINTVRPDIADGGTDVFRCKASGEDHWTTKFRRLLGQRPIKLFAGAAQLARHVAVQQPRADLVPRKLIE